MHGDFTVDSSCCLASTKQMQLLTYVPTFCEPDKICGKNIMDSDFGYELFGGLQYFSLLYTQCRLRIEYALSFK